MLPSPRGARIRGRIAGYLPVLQNLDLIDLDLCRGLLKDIQSPTLGPQREDLKWEIGAASHILERLDRLALPKFDDVDDEALAAMGFQ